MQWTWRGQQEPAPPVRSVVVILSDPDQPEASPERHEPGPLGPSERMTLDEPAASPVTSLPCTPGRDIHLPANSEESLRSREGRVAAVTLEQEMGRRSVAVAIRLIKDRAVASSSSAAGPVTERMVAEACGTLIREKHSASPPEWPKDTGTPAQGDQGWPGETKILQEPPPPLDARQRQHQDQSEVGPRWERCRGQFKPCSVQALSAGRKNHRPYASTSPRPRSLGAMEATSQRTGEGGGRSDTTEWHGPLPTRMGTRKERGESRRKPWQLSLPPN